MIRKLFRWTLLVVLIAVAAGALWAWRKFRIVTPAWAPPARVVTVDQGWNDQQRLTFHHTSQGTRLLPYDWFLALEQPCLKITACGALADPEYLARFGFLSSRPDPALNPDNLPVGFARQAGFTDPMTGERYPAVGLNCAACHTGQLEVGDTAVRIEGAPAMIEITVFQTAVGEALFLTRHLPFRYSRFEKKVLGENASAEAREALRTRIDALLNTGAKEKLAVEKRGVYRLPAGFARTDALTRIGNQVFAVDMDIEDNFAVADSPVRYPQIWDASWFTWVQYNSSIADPLVRNIGEALGVRALAQLSGPRAKELNNSIHMEGLKTLEDLLSGEQPFGGLRSPKWPAAFPALDPAKVARGEAVYRERCIGCHLPPPAELEADRLSAAPKYWTSNNLGKQFLKMRDVPLTVIGTDPRQALNFKGRTADTGGLGKGRVSAGDGLALVTLGIRDKWFREARLTPAEQAEWMGYRDPGEPAVRSLAVYKARPLNGIWAAAPYLHNGSVPDLFALLSPEAERPQRFWLGTRQFDPVRVGYRSAEEIPGGTHFDTSQTGNSNHGHRFEDQKGAGVIGPALSPADRWAVIEYLKSL